MECFMQRSVSQTLVVLGQILAADPANTEGKPSSAVSVGQQIGVRGWLVCSPVSDRAEMK